MPVCACNCEARRPGAKLRWSLTAATVMAALPRAWLARVEESIEAAVALLCLFSDRAGCPAFS